MNARLYDPKIHRFLATDNFVQDPGNPQNYNLYGYVFNNPLRYTDPSGNYAVVDDIIAAVVGGIINLGVNIYQGNIKGNFWDAVGKGAAAFGAGAVGGWAALYPEFGGWVWGGAIVGGTNAWLSGENVTEGAIFGGITGAVGGALGSWVGSGMTVAVQGIRVSSPVLQGAITGGLGGAAVGGIMNGAIVTIQTGSFSAGIEAFGTGAAMGFATGSVSGAGAGYGSAVKNQISAWNGSSKGTSPSGSIAVDDALAPATKSLNAQIEDLKIDFRKSMNIEPIELTTSSKSWKPSRVYTIYEAGGEVYKFGVTDAKLFRFKQSLLEAGPNAYGKYSNEMPKFKAHISEKYLRSLYFNSTGNYYMRGMTYPYPVNFDTGSRISPKAYENWRLDISRL